MRVGAKLWTVGRACSFFLTMGWLVVSCAAAQDARKQQTSESAASLNTDKTQQHIDALIEQLGDPSFIKREAAKDELEKFGLLAFESLRAAEMHPNVEISHSATYLLESMNVVWSLPTDSFEVQRLLKGYDQFNLRSKTDAMQRLAKLGKADGYLALLRLMRYEKDEKMSKLAGLHVMEAAIDALSPKDANDPNALPRDADSDIPWKLLITMGSSESPRPTAKWLMTLADQLDAATVATDAWQKHVSQERMLLESNARARTQSRLKTDEEIVKRLYRVVARLMISKSQNDQALDFFEPCLDLISKEQKEAFNDLQWMLEAGLLQAIERLNELRPELFAARTRNRYLLAEALLKLGKVEQANRTASEASDLTNFPADMARRIMQGNPTDAEAMQRHANSDYLLQRGLFDWSEAELKRVLKKSEDDKQQLSIGLELDTRRRLAVYYWSGGQYAEAAQAWEPIMLRAGLMEDATANPVNKDLRTELMHRSSDDVPYIKYVPSHYYFYLGLAEIEQKNWKQAREHLRKAAENDASDPDLLIAMYRSAQDDAEYAKLTDQFIELLETSYRVELEKIESELSMSRGGRSSYSTLVAMQCNQLAWLLSCTHRKVPDALMLSQRACNLVPNEGVYMDTLARCYFSAGNIDKAIEMQTQAIKHSPFERSMRRQLAEFQAAKKSQ